AEPALQSGKYRTVYCDNVSGIYAFLRKKDDDEILVILNNSDRESSFSLPEEFQNRQWKDLITGENFSVTTIVGYTGKILKTI
ncbi:MAG: alpha-glucosidase C-terminal domain-containing protein, partial [Lachnospiraceae bacterium]|nr:alpha-glucosidase C-terminal domain-containing protein [Lachnospiraceae bacterium]